MAINEEYRQLEVAREAEELLRTLAHSTRAVPNPQDSYPLLGELVAMVDHLTQVTRQLAHWHAGTEDGTHYAGEDGGTTGSTHAAGNALNEARQALRTASEAISKAYTANGVVRWYPEPQEN